MNVIESQVIADRVVHFYANIANYKKAITVKHFVSEGIKQRRIYYILERYESTGSSKFKLKTGRKRTVATPQVIKKVIKYFKNSNMSVREVVGKLKKPKTTVHNIKQRNGIKSNKCTVVPKYTEKQKKLAKTNCRIIYRESTYQILIIDDETYVMADPKDTPGNNYYHYTD
jgi:hypothetical protein